MHRREIIIRFPLNDINDLFSISMEIIAGSVAPTVAKSGTVYLLTHRSLDCLLCDFFLLSLPESCYRHTTRIDYTEWSLKRRPNS